MKFIEFLLVALLWMHCGDYRHAENNTADISGDSHETSQDTDVNLGGNTMAWSLKTFLTNSDGLISNAETLNAAAIGRIKHTLGDKLYIKSGDITLQHFEALGADDPAGFVRWIAVYFNTNLINVYPVYKEFDEHDEKHTTRYSSKLTSIQKWWMDRIKYHSIGINDVDASGAVEISMIQLENSVSGLTDRWGYSLGDVLDNMPSSSDVYNHCALHSITTPGSKKDSGPVPIFWRGESKDYTSDPITTANAFTFGNIALYPDWSAKWLDLFKMCAVMYNGWIAVKPIIYESSGDTLLGVDIEVKARTYLTPLDVKNIDWIERTKKLDGYQVINAHITSNVNDSDGNPSIDWLYMVGLDTGDNYEQTIPFADPNSDFGSVQNYLFLAMGTYQSGTGKYQVLDVSYENESWFDQGISELYFANSVGINNGAGYKGKILYNGELPGDFGYAGTDTIQIVGIEIEKDNRGRPVADIEGIVIP